tara:strand:+ start:222 stop:386 length:165 start_codon:yes stop_codon:yes gene_type:complete
MLGYSREEIKEVLNKTQKVEDDLGGCISALDEYEKTIQGLIGSIDKLNKEFKEL